MGWVSYKYETYTKLIGCQFKDVNLYHLTKQASNYDDKILIKKALLSKNRGTVDLEWGHWEANTHDYHISYILISTTAPKDFTDQSKLNCNI